MAELSREDLEAAKLLLEDLLEGRDQLLTAGEVAELLNINVNTLYLWRASGEVDLPFQRFISPGQTRGVIRYKYSDVVLFLARAQRRGAEEAELEAVEGSENEDGVPVKVPTALARKKNARRKQKLSEKLKNTPLEELLSATPHGMNMPVAEFKDQRRTELAPPEEYEVVDGDRVFMVRAGVCLTCGGAVLNSGEHIEPERHDAALADTPEEKAETQVPEPTVEPVADQAAAAEWLARFTAAFNQEGAPPDAHD